MITGWLGLVCNVFQMGSYFGYAVAATDINSDGWVTEVTDDSKSEWNVGEM